MEQSSYQLLLERTKGGIGKIDPYTLHTFATLAEAGQDVENFAAPMLALIRLEGLGKVSENATVYSRIDNIVVLAATPAQLLVLISMPEVISLEASRSY